MCDAGNPDDQAREGRSDGRTGWILRASDTHDWLAGAGRHAREIDINAAMLRMGYQRRVKKRIAEQQD